MPFSFIEIEKEKSRSIVLVFIFLILFYFATAYLVLVVSQSFSSLYTCGISRGCLIALPNSRSALVAFLIAFLAGLIHWALSTNHLIENISARIDAAPADPQDMYHKYLQGIVEEVSVAIGGRRIETLIVRDASLNAFALEDFGGRAVIGVTEGLLSRLSRQHIEAVVAHEAGHIARGDCLSTTVVCSIGEIYEQGFSRIRSALKGAGARSPAILVVLFLVIGFMNLLSSLMRFFISREREYRADAVAVRLTRDPLSLAEALKLISKNWRGGMGNVEGIESIFILNPSLNSLDETEGLWPDMFSTHPPIAKRISILLDMAHLDESALMEKLKNYKRYSPVAVVEAEPIEETASKKWLVLQDGQWQGPFALAELKAMPGFGHDDWVKISGTAAQMPAYYDDDLKSLFLSREEGAARDNLITDCCPHCCVRLHEVIYEGAPILKCSLCEGVLAGENKISRILIRQDYQPSPEIERMAQPLLKSKEIFNPGSFQTNDAWNLICPHCQRRMHRQPYMYSYPVIIDSCFYCGAAWFDKYELQILQFIYENKEKFLFL